MNFKMFVLGKSEKLDIDNKDFNIINFQDKLREEYKEVMYEADIVRVNRKNDSLKARYHRSRLASEILDLMQICIAGLVMLAKESIDIQLIFTKHNFKLLHERKWTFEQVINIDVEENYNGGDI